jgi:hypothetical protein
MFSSQIVLDPFSQSLFCANEIIFFLDVFRELYRNNKGWTTRGTRVKDHRDEPVRHAQEEKQGRNDHQTSPG